MNKHILSIKNLSFSFGKTPVLNAIDFDLNRGEYLSIIGPNGAGKSTLLKSLLRLHDDGKPLGEINIKGKSINEYKQHDLAKIISYVPQAGGWIPPFTVQNFLHLSRYPHHVGYDKTKPNNNEKHCDPIEKALTLTKMHGFAKRTLRSLSGGERQKAFIAAALAQEAEVMLLDEPASFLDPKHTADLNRLLKKLNQEQNLTMLVVTHDLNQAFSADGQALVLKEGRQLYFGQAEKLLNTKILEQAFEHTFTFFPHPHAGRTIVLAD